MLRNVIEMDGMSVVSVIVTLVGQVTHVIVTLVRHRRKLVERGLYLLKPRQIRY